MRWLGGPRLEQLGTDPDPRFTYANERTFLAWSRTSLALVVTGVAATQLLPALDIQFGRRLIGVPLIVLGAVLELLAYQHWYANERAMRLDEPLPPTRLGVVLALGIAVVSVIAIVVVVLE
jgi:putative membrane protein